MRRTLVPGLITAAALSLFALLAPTAEAQTMIYVAPWFAIFPGLAVALTVLGLNLMGDGLRDALDPRLKGRA